MYISFRSEQYEISSIVRTRRIHLVIDQCRKNFLHMTQEVFAKSDVHTTDDGALDFIFVPVA